jgi:hypothetical protein
MSYSPELPGVDRFTRAMVIATPATVAFRLIEDGLGIQFERPVRAEFFTDTAFVTQRFIDVFESHVVSGPAT